MYEIFTQLGPSEGLMAKPQPGEGEQGANRNIKSL